MLAVADAGFGYASSDGAVFSDISFTLAEGESLCLLGPNGSGKTTLLKCIAGLMPLRAGRVCVGGRDLATLGRRRIARMLAYVPQFHHPVFAYSVFDIVLMGRSPHIGFMAAPSDADRTIAWESLQAIGIEHLAAKAYTEISGGERQLAMFARVLAQQPRVLLLDEPTAHLDFSNQIQVLALVRRLAADGIVVVMTSHTPDHAFMATRQVALMTGGGLRLGRPADVLTEDRLSAIYGVAIHVVAMPDGRRTCIPVMPST